MSVGALAGCRWLATAALLLPGARAQEAEVEAPPPRVPASLVCIPRALEPAGLGAANTILHVGVRNPLDRVVEPLSFRLFLPGPPERELLVARVPLPHVGRRGRPIAPGARAQYALAVPRAMGELQDFRASVETAVFFEEPPAPIEAPRVSGVAARLGQDAVQVENPGALVLDVVLEVTYGAARAPSLHPLRIGPGERVTWELPPPVGWSSAAGARRPRAIQARVVDACALEPGAEPGADFDEPARRAFAGAVAGWLGAPTTADGTVGLFEFDRRTGARVVHGRGRFEVVGEGVSVTPLEPWEELADGAAARESLAALFDLRARRPSLDDLVDRVAPRLRAASPEEIVLGVEAFPAAGVDAPALVGLRAGRLAWVSGATLGEPPLRRWRTRPFGAGYVRVGVDRYDAPALDPLRPDRLVRWSFEDEPGPRGTRNPVPVELRSREFDERGALRSATRVAVSWLGDGERRSSAAGRDEPEAREALREAWERPLRYGGPGTWRGRAELLAAAPRAGWNGRDFVSGTFELDGLRCGGWVRLDFEPLDATESGSGGPPAQATEEDTKGDAPEAEGRPDGKAAGKAAKRRPSSRSSAPALPVTPLDDAARREIAEGVEERLAAWTRLDFAHRAPFELLFGEASIRRLGSDIVIEGSPIRRVRLEDGLPVQVTEADGTRLDVEYLTLPEAVLPVRVQRRGRTLEILHARVGADWLPRRLVLGGFPPEGGVETLLLEAWQPH